MIDDFDHLDTRDLDYLEPDDEVDENNDMVILSVFAYTF